uniref:Ig-like domain-containing protein n=1 Tax=Cyclopterus lumpus TaxID=8103 RepID=A0A8C2WGF2_CYCLU
MFVTPITLLCLLPFVAGKFTSTLLLLLLLSSSLFRAPSRAVCPDSPIVAAEGSAVTLPCHLEPQVNVQSRTVDWRRLDSCVQVLPGRVLPGLVHGYRYRKQNLNDQRVEFRNRTTLHGDLSRGNLSLLISSVTPKDSGSYRCFNEEPRLIRNLLHLLIRLFS